MIIAKRFPVVALFENHCWPARRPAAVLLPLASKSNQRCICRLYKHLPYRFLAWHQSGSQE